MMKKFLVICALCLSHIFWAWGGATNNVTTYMIFLTDASGNYLMAPTDYSENDVLQHFSAVLTWSGQTVTIAPGATDSQARFMLQAHPNGGYFIILRITLQRFQGTIPLQIDDSVNSIVKVAITTSDGYTKETDIPRTTAGSVQRVEIDMAH